MHEYVCPPASRVKVVFWIAIASVAVSIGVGAALKAVSFVPPEFAAPPAVATVFAILFAIYDRWVWRLKPFGKRVSKIPDLRGDWHGTIDIREGDKSATGTYECQASIRQTWNRIAIEFKTDFSKSHSTLASLTTDGSAPAALRYEYDVSTISGAKLPTDWGTRHYGVAHLNPAEPEWSKLEGKYYNDDDYQRWGVYKLERGQR
jgi:hypothetical protein